MQKTFYNSEKIFVIINTMNLGDTLLTNALAANIKHIFKDSKVVRITHPELYEAVKYQPYTDDVVIWDRKKGGKHHGFFGTLDFIKNFPYKKIYAAIPVFGNDRSVIISGLLNPKYILSESYTNIKKTSLINSIFKKSKYKIIEDLNMSVQARLCNLLTGVTKEKIINYPILFNAPDTNLEKFAELKEFVGEYIVLSPVSAQLTKNMPVDTVKEILKTASNQKFVLCGQGAVAEKYSKELSAEKFDNLIDLVNLTTISELAEICNNSKSVISVDTGILHLSVALKKQVVLVYYEKVNKWCPSVDLYDVKIISSNQTAENILKTLGEFK